MDGCAEYRLLQNHYEATLELWEQHRHPNVRAINTVKVTSEEASKERESALQLRNAAANLVYLHTRDCAICRRARIEKTFPPSDP
jgi:hypothetical protein